MGLFEKLEDDYRKHRKVRSTKHALYPMRFPVPDEKVSWYTVYNDYAPVEYTAPVVLNPSTPWADPSTLSKVSHPFQSFCGEVRFSDSGFPVNPFGRTGIKGRGVLGKWGANFAVDAIITTINPVANQLFVLTIARRDTGEMAFPGGMVDKGENPIQARNRELEEELSMQSGMLESALYEKIVFQGYVDDPRNTDNAWLETTAIHSHIPYEQVKWLNLKAGDDAASFAWHPVQSKSFSLFYASHGVTLMTALKHFLESKHHDIPRETNEILSSILVSL
jgi:ADP-ribose pyrophosphatase